MEQDILLQHLLEPHRQELENILADIAEHTDGYKTITWNFELGSITLTFGTRKEMFSKTTEGLNEAAVRYANRCAKDGIDHELIKQHFKAGAEWAFGQFESAGTFPVEDARGGYWPTEYFIRKK